MQNKLKAQENNLSMVLAQQAQQRPAYQVLPDQADYTV